MFNIDQVSMRTSEVVDKIVPALLAVKKELQGVKKSSNNPFYKSKYADLNNHLDVVEPVLEKYNCFVMQPPTVDRNGNNNVITRIFHESGQWVEGSLKLLEEKDHQKLGAGVTYLRRFILSGMFSMQAIDDDGNTATGKELAAVKPSFVPSKAIVKTGFAAKAPIVNAEIKPTKEIY